jgi:hypothetical protein
VEKGNQSGFMASNGWRKEKGGEAKRRVKDFPAEKHF